MDKACEWYRPKVMSKALEIALMSIKTTTADVTRLYARRVGRRLPACVTKHLGTSCLNNESATVVRPPAHGSEKGSRVAHTNLIMR
jgi:hypothetical protein